MPNRRNFTILAKSLFALALLGNASGSLTQTQSGRSTHDISTQEKKRLERFGKQVDDLRARLKIPGLSAVVLKDQKVVWIKVFGFADLENKIPTTPDKLPDSPLSGYSVTVGNDGSRRFATSRQGQRGCLVLTTTSGIPVNFRQQVHGMRAISELLGPFHSQKSKISGIATAG